MLPAFGPAQNSESPLNMEFYGRGYVEVPRCVPPVNQAGYGRQGYPGVAPAQYQGVPVAPMAPPAMPPATSPTVGRGIESTTTPRSPQANNLPFGAGPRR
jgi:hypothetical protein